MEIFGNLGHFPQRKTSSAGIAPPVPGTAPPRLALTWATPDVGDGERTLRRHQRLMRSQSRCSRPRVLATEGFPDPCSPRANPLARHHHGHRPHLRQVRRHGEPSEEPGTRAAGSRQPEWHEAGGRGQEAEGGGQRKPGTGGGIGDAPRPALAPGPHNPPRCCRSTTGCTSLRGGRGSRGGVGIGCWVAGQHDQAGWFAP